MVAASIMILKLMGQGWMTVFRMLKSDAGMLNPEDLLPGPANRNPRPEQLLANDYVERSRRMQRNDLENIPAFLAAGLIFVAAQPSLCAGQQPDDCLRGRQTVPRCGLRDRAASRSARHLLLDRVDCRDRHGALRACGRAGLKRGHGADGRRRAAQRCRSQPTKARSTTKLAGLAVGAFLEAEASRPVP